MATANNDENFGICKYRSDRRRYRMKATLKKFCEDFEVHEISLNGLLAGISHNTKPCPNNTEECPNKKVKLDAHNSDANFHGVPINQDTGSSVHREIQTPNVSHPGNSTKSSKTSTENFCETADTISFTMVEDIEEIKWMTSIDEVHEFLSKKFSDEVVAQIKTFDETSEDLLLGVFNKKSERALLHEVVRYVNPFIEVKTVTTHGQSQMSCIFNDSVPALLQCFQTPEIVRAFLTFVNCRNLLHHLPEHLDNFDKELYTLSISVEGFTKNERKYVHQTIAKSYSKLLLSKTITKNGKSFVSISFRPKPFRNTKRELKHEQIFEFVLRKRNIEMLDALNLISYRLKLPKSRLSYAGMKDKKGVTYQFITAACDVTDDLCMHECGQTYHDSDWSISNAIKVEKMLQPGCLKGNRFLIRARDIVATYTDGSSSMCSKEGVENLLREAAPDIMKYGFINYFGYQRFGEFGESPEVGLKLLNEEYVAAVNIILRPRDVNITKEMSKREIAKKYFRETQDIKGTLKMMPKSCRRERLILEGFERWGSDSEKACKLSIHNIPHHLLMLYTHAYTSLVWNKVVSQRIEKYGFQVLEGDLIETNGDVKVVSSDELESYTIDDVVLPLPSRTARYPDNVTKDIFDDVLTRDHAFDNEKRFPLLKGKVSGTYRKIVTKPSEFNYDIIKTCDDGCDVLLTFDLPSSSYATMLIRELFHN